eukprot:2645179-Pyramimonas_sp.AAC.1
MRARHRALAKARRARGRRTKCCGEIGLCGDLLISASVPMLMGLWPWMSETKSRRVVAVHAAPMYDTWHGPSFVQESSPASLR